MFRFFIVLFLVGSVDSMFAQSEPFGVRFGVVSSGVFGNYIDNDTRVLGYHLGAYKNLVHSPQMASIITLGIEKLGYELVAFETTINDPIWTPIPPSTTGLTYISFGYQIKYLFSDNKASLFLSGGPNVSYLAHRNYGIFEFSADSIEDNTSQGFKDIILGANLSAGLNNVKIFGLNCRPEVRVGLDISNSMKNSDSLKYRANTLSFILNIDLEKF